MENIPPAGAMVPAAPAPEREMDDEVREPRDFDEGGPVEEFAPHEDEERQPPPPPPERRDFQPASPAAVTEAIDEVNRIIATLKQSLDTMDEILETLELAEVQKTADEREIHSLRNALRTFDRPGASGEPRREAPRRDDQRRRGRR